MIKEFLDKVGLQKYHEHLKNALKIKADQSALDTLSATVNSKADQSAVDDLTAVVNNKADATALENKADKTTVNDLASVINNKADQTVVDDLADQIDSKVDQSALEAKADKTIVDDLKNIIYGGDDDQFLVGFTDEAPVWCDCSEVQATLEIDKKANQSDLDDLKNIIMSGGEEIGDDGFMVSCSADTPGWISCEETAEKLAYDLNRIHGLDDLKQRVTNLENSGGGSSGGSSYSSTYKLLGRHEFTNATSGYVNMTSYYNQYDDVMIIARIECTSSTNLYISSNTTANTSGLISATSVNSSSGAYRRIDYNKTDDNYKCWQSGTTVGWSSSEWKYLRYYSSGGGVTKVTFVIYGR